MALGRIEFRSVPQGVREWGKFFAGITVTPDTNSVGSTEIDESAVTTDKIANSNVTLAKLQNVTANSILGRLSTDGPPQELTATQTVALLETASWEFSAVVEFGNVVQFNAAVSLDGTVGFFDVAPASQQAHIEDASVAHVLNSTFDNDEVEDALDVLGEKINAILLILETFGLKATS